MANLIIETKKHGMYEESCQVYEDTGATKRLIATIEFSPYTPRGYKPQYKCTYAVDNSVTIWPWMVQAIDSVRREYAMRGR